MLFKLTTQLRDPAFDDADGDGDEKDNWPECLAKLSSFIREKSQLLVDEVDGGGKVEEDDLLWT